MPDPASQTLLEAFTTVLEQFVRDLVEGQPVYPGKVAEQLIVELLPQPHLPASAEVSYANGMLVGALGSRGGQLVGIPLVDGTYGDVLHWQDAFDRVWTLRVVGRVQS